jgi:hypothetical protein
MKPSHQDEHVTEADMVGRLMSNLRLPIIRDIPTMVNEVWRRAGVDGYFNFCPMDRNLCEPSKSGSIKSLQLYRQVSSVVRHVKESERNLSLRINCYVSNAGTGSDSLRGRRADRQCPSRGSEAEVVDGVTSIQGTCERHVQGEGPYILDAT